MMRLVIDNSRDVCHVVILWNAQAADMVDAKPAPRQASGDDLFRWIEQREAQQPQPWGRVLDAGTGHHSLAWLRALVATNAHMGSVVAVTGEPHLATALAQDDGVHVCAGNWVDDQFLHDEAPFDVIIADYLIGAIDGFAPYFQDQVINRLMRHLARGGRIYVIGLEPLCSLPADGDVGAFWVQEMARIRDACILLAGKRCYREFPMTWTERQLRKAGLTIRSSVRMTNVYTMASIGRQLQVARNQLVAFRDEALAQSMQQAIERMYTDVNKALGASGKIKFGFDYILMASREEQP
ncbi:TPA: hypothetical protein N0F65_006481 [Lagenidium giganteum]|uniref:Uncharacterized protein n=1 Tax=Lagenidium giganteum TaxID=4803 RepID=A0AAV2YQS1_9STRA|nr:TPA: hypothetical protein N0F65_006481 [Lagenidium giganteum]